ncbi:hypothetical protein [Flavobacterium psychrotrophum]|uniref:hypothetical protein n=1 Tax=Flavobacterium psychrotrophum TaxID=2294119 RepID=UPI0013C4B20E|nr:hypothetical protein [Flavobacterium psychrotrophum]
MKAIKLFVPLLTSLIAGDALGTMFNVLNMISATVLTLKQKQKNKSSALENLSIFK